MALFVPEEGLGRDAGNGTAEFQSVNASLGLGRQREEKESDAILRLTLPAWYG